MSYKEIKLGERHVGVLSRPYIIAEIGVNHEGNIERAKTLIEQAARGGADVAKFQTYKAEKLASKESPSYWDLSKEPITSQRELFQKFDGFEDEHYESLAAHCKQVGIEFCSTPFDDEALESLDPIVPFFKIASADLTNIPFVRKVAKKNKPVILSTGASKMWEIGLAVDELTKAGCDQLVLMHCILNYPTDYENANLRMINSLKDSYPNLQIGYSDHTLPDKWMSSLTTAYALGAVVLEKHFTDDKSKEGNDHYHAMDESDLANFRLVSDRIWASLGASTFKHSIETENISRKNARRSIVTARSVAADTVLTETDLTYKRPGHGISPVQWDDVIGSVARIDLPSDHILRWSDLD